MEDPADRPDHEGMASDLDNIAKELERQHRDLEERKPLWDGGRFRATGDGEVEEPKRP